MQEPAPEFTMPAADLELDAVTKFVSHVGPEEVRTRRTRPAPWTEIPETLYALNAATY